MSKDEGRYRVIDLKTNRQFQVEPVGKPRTEFGDSIDDKCDASIRERDSVISADTHKNVGYAANPEDYIKRLLRKG